MKKYPYLIVGAGFTGATFAQQMQSQGKQCLVIEKRPYVGGLSYTEDIENIDVHIHGAHIFHTNRSDIWNYVNQFSMFNHFINSPMAIYQGKIYNLPFNMNTFSKMWDITSPLEAKAIIDDQIRTYGVKDPQNLEEHAISSVGKDIYDVLIKGYTEKQWGMEAVKLPAFIIKRLPIRFTYDNNYFDDRFQGIPDEGYTKMIQNMLKGVEVELNTDYFSNKEYFDSLAEKTVYTGAIDRFFNFQYGRLDYRSLRFETEILACSNYQGNAVINYTEKSAPYTRIIEHKHFNPKPNQIKTVVTHEYPEVFDLANEPYYPINNSENQQLYQRYFALSKKYPRVIFVGRLAEYKYYNMDQAIASARDRVKEELDKTTR
ncbi:MAG: UDP-galactopyranose mutase [Candidatus Izemoplasmatales bacterium]|nr:UDP-galactopyranose mutase [Candidatus Izemoplasmatales bacterium]